MSVLRIADNGNQQSEQTNHMRTCVMPVLCWAKGAVSWQAFWINPENGPIPMHNTICHCVSTFLSSCFLFAFWSIAIMFKSRKTAMLQLSSINSASMTGSLQTPTLLSWKKTWLLRLIPPFEQWHQLEISWNRITFNQKMKTFKFLHLNFDVLVWTFQRHWILASRSPASTAVALNNLCPSTPILDSWSLARCRPLNACWRSMAAIRNHNSREGHCGFGWGLGFIWLLLQFPDAFDGTGIFLACRLGLHWYSRTLTTQRKTLKAVTTPPALGYFPINPHHTLKTARPMKVWQGTL